ncbi:MAG: ABC transporter ATP-binding protein [Clostridiales bacterium]|nr:ABC transporter ATP-binding protein [Clostridiales bacterium]
MVGEVLCDLMQPTLMSEIVDKGVLASNMPIIWKCGLIMICVAVLGGIAGLGSAGFASAASQSFGRDLRKDVYSRIMTLSLEQTDRFTTGSLITRLTNDITVVQDLVAMALRMFVRSPLMFLGGIVMALTISPKFAIVLTVSLPIQLAGIWLIIGKAGPIFSQLQSKIDSVNSVVQENVSGARVVKAYVSEEREEARFETANRNLMEVNLKVAKIFARLGPSLSIVMNLSVIVIIYVGGLQIDAQELQVGKVMAAVTYTTQVLMSIMMVSMMFVFASRAKASADRIREVLDTYPIIKSGEIDKPFNDSSVEFDNVSFSYPTGSGREVLTDISFKINSGEKIAILGSTGSGKSTLISILPRFYDVNSGRVLVGGVNIKNYKLDRLRSEIAVVLQKSELFSGTIRENILWGKPDATDEEILEASKVAQADEYISRFNDGYETMVGEKGTSLSGGQRQRMCIARAIIRKPKILIFDDATSALDLATEAKLREALNEQLADTTVIMIAQRIASVKNSDRILVLDEGKIVGYAPHNELMKSCPVYIDIYNSQNKKEDGTNE